MAITDRLVFKLVSVMQRDSIYTDNCWVSAYEMLYCLNGINNVHYMSLNLRFTTFYLYGCCRCVKLVTLYRTPQRHL